MIGPENIGHHSFGGVGAGKRKNGFSREQNGLTFSCKAGFIDLAHLRDNADWTAHLIWLLPKYLGTGQFAAVRREGGAKRGLFFPELPASEIRSLTESDIALIAQKISYEFSVWHEIITGLGAHVTAPFVKEISSSFSVEDSFSNLLGTWLGARAALDARPYNDAMTEVLAETLEELRALPLEKTIEAHQAVKDIWWRQRIFPFKGVGMKRQMQVYGELKPFIPAATGKFGCSPSDQPITLAVPGVELDRYFQIRIVPNRPTGRKIRKILGRRVGFLTQKDFPALIEGVRERFSHFLEKDFDQP
jgi:hypothetical protein